LQFVATKLNVASTKSNVASTLLLVGKGPKLSNLDTARTC